MCSEVQSLNIAFCIVKKLHHVFYKNKPSIVQKLKPQRDHKKRSNASRIMQTSKIERFHIIKIPKTQKPCILNFYNPKFPYQILSVFQSARVSI